MKTTLHRKSVKLLEADWQELERLAADADCFYNGKPSWRRLLLKLARGHFTLQYGHGKRKAGKDIRPGRPHAAWTGEDLQRHAEMQRLYQEKRRRRAGILPRSAVEDLAALQEDNGP